MIINSKLSLLIFGNTLGLLQNALWKFHHLICVLLCKFKDIGTIKGAAHKEKVISLKKTGIAILDVVDLKNLKEYIDNKLNHEPLKPEIQLSRVADNFIAQEIYKILKKNEIFFYEYYRTHFQTYWITISKMFPQPHRDDNSFGWHIDDNPKQLLKIFIYLSDSTKETGAFRAFDYKTSRKIYRRGFLSFTPNDRVRSQKIVKEFDPTLINVVEGTKGTVFVFDNNIVHKGTPPESKYRSVICIEVYPDYQKLSLENIQKSLSLPIKRDYPSNPFKNEYKLESNTQ